MAITRKPKLPAESVNVEALINKGGSVAQRPPNGNPVTPVIVRLPSEILRQIDTALKARPVKVPRHTWILEAIVEKLGREG